MCIIQVVHVVVCSVAVYCYHMYDACGTYVLGGKIAIPMTSPHWAITLPDYVSYLSGNTIAA